MSTSPKRKRDEPSSSRKKARPAGDPTDPQQWNVEQVAEYFENVADIPGFASTVQSKRIDGRCLHSFSSDDFEEVVGDLVTRHQVTSPRSTATA